MNFEPDPVQARQTCGASSGSPEVATPYLSRGGLATLTLLVTGAAVAYITIQFRQTGTVVDIPFTSMLIGATVILLLGMKAILRFVNRKGLEFYSFVLSMGDPRDAYLRHGELCSSLTSLRGATLSGAVYGILLGLAPFFLHVWQNELPIRLALAAFMALVNFVTGVGFYGLIQFLIQSLRLGTMAKVDLWQARNPSTEFLLGTIRRIALLASVYVAICISSILFSVLPLGGWVAGYSAFACLSIVASILVPSIPVVRRIRVSKTLALGELDQQIQTEFFATLETLRVGGGDEHLDKLHAMLQLRERIDAINSWPFRLKSLSAVFSVMLVSSIPVILQKVLERFAK